MKKGLMSTVAFIMVAMASSSFAAVLSSKSYDSQVNFRLQGNAPSFDVYATVNSTTPVTNFDFGNQMADKVGTNKKISIAKRYVEILPGDAMWNLIVYTKNTLTPQDNDSNLYWDNDSKVKMIWKYKNALQSNFDNDGTPGAPVGSTISAADWEGAGAKYKYFVYALNGSSQLSAGDKAFATIANYRNVPELNGQVNAVTNPNGRVQIVFGVDLKSTYLHGVYKTKVGFELYTN